MKRKKKQNENIEKFDFMKTNKDNINNIIKNKEILPTIEDLVFRVHKIVTHAYLFLKMYCIHFYTNKKSLPTIDKEYICDIFKAITKRKCNSGGYREDNMPEQQKTLTKFFNDYYKKTMDEKDIMYYDGLPYILAYEAIDMVTNINNNIEMHFVDHLNKYTNLVYDIKNKATKITQENKDKTIRKELHKQLYGEIQKVKNDLMSTADLTSDPKYHAWIKEQRKLIFKDKSFDKDSIHYDLKSNTQTYLHSIFYILGEFEKMNNKILEDNKKNGIDNKQIRLFNVLPLRTSIVPKHICIDTPALIMNFLEGESTAKYLASYKKENKYDELWSKFFNLKNRVFKKNKYVFSNMIRTDGVSCCILFIRTDSDGKPLKKTQQNKSNKGEESIEYIEKVEITSEMKTKKIIAIDPGYSDLIYCGSRNKEGELETFRYTQNQRRLETRNKKYIKMVDKMNKKEKVGKQTVKEIETELSKKNRKTCNYETFKEYAVEKNKTNKILNDHYNKNIFRKLKLNRFTNTQKSESKMIKNFIIKFGNPKDLIIAFGDYSKGENMRGKEPAICKRFRRLFRNAGIIIYLIDEFRTSKLCNECHEELEKFMERLSHKPHLHKDNKKELVHGLLRCQSVKHKCEVYHNRDKNAVQNMLNIVDHVFKNGKRPTEYLRT